MPNKVMPESVDMEFKLDEKTSFGLGSHSADQETQDDSGIGSGRPESGTASPTKTGTY